MLSQHAITGDATSQVSGVTVSVVGRDLTDGERDRLCRFFRMHGRCLYQLVLVWSTLKYSTYANALSMHDPTRAGRPGTGKVMNRFALN